MTKSDIAKQEALVKGDTTNTEIMKDETEDMTGGNIDNGVAIKTDVKKTKKKGKVKLDVQKKILAWMGQELQVDRLDVKKQEVAEGCGFQYAGTHSFFYAWQDLEKNKAWIAKAPSAKGCFRLTETGRDNIPMDVVLVSAKKDNAGKQEFFKATLIKQCKEAKKDKVDIMFDILKDGEHHPLQEFIDKTGYANLKSKGLGYPLSHMENKMKIVEKSDKMYWFTDKCFPEGRP